MQDKFGTGYRVVFLDDDWRWHQAEEEVLLVVLPRSEHNTAESLKAKMKELDLLREFNTYEEVDLNNLTDRQKESVIHMMWVIVEKEKDGKTIRKGRLCAKGFQETTEVRTDSPTISKQALKVALAVTVDKGWRICSVDAKSAFLQGTSIEREVFVKPPREFHGKFGKTVWRLKKVLYGLKDAPRAWYVRVDQFLKSLGCITSYK